MSACSLKLLLAAANISLGYRLEAEKELACRCPMVTKGTKTPLKRVKITHGVKITHFFSKMHLDRIRQAASPASSV